MGLSAHFLCPSNSPTPEDVNIARMKQTKLESLFEVCINISIGWVVAYLFFTFAIVPFFHLPVNHGQNFEITSAFTVLAVVRGYFVRRYFNARIHRLAHSWAEGFNK